MSFIVIETSTGRRLDGFPTPALIENGGGLAYEQSPGIWRLRDIDYGDPGYDPKGTEYTRVRVAKVWRYIVDLNIEVVDPSDDFGPEPEYMAIHVDARDPHEAQDLAKETAIERTREWAGDVSAIVTFIKTERQD